MTVPTTLAKFSDIQTTFGGSNPISMSEYYKGGANVPSNQATSATDGTAIPTSGLIRVGEFRGLSKTAAGTVQTGGSLSEYSIYSIGLPAAITFNPNGTFYANTTGSHNWVLPISSGIGSSYYAYFHATSSISGITSPTLDTWLSLGTARTLTSGYAYGASYFGQYSVQIAASPGGTVLATWYFALSFDGYS